MKARHLLLLAAALAGFLWQAIDSTNHPVFAQATVSKQPVYVRNFLFDSQNLKPDEGLLGRREGPVGRLLRGLKPSEDPAAKARELVTLLSNTIVAELNNAGIRATRLEPGALMPQDGLLVGGEFLEVDEGNRMTTYTDFRHRVGRALMLGLEILVAADIIRTVVLDPTLSNVLVLGLLVLIRTFLSWSLVLEIEERWPWQASQGRTKD